MWEDMQGRAESWYIYSMASEMHGKGMCKSWTAGPGYSNFHVDCTSDLGR